MPHALPPLQAPPPMSMSPLSSWLLHHKEAAEELTDDKLVKKVVIRLIDRRLVRIARYLARQHDLIEPHIDRFIGGYKLYIGEEQVYVQALFYSTVVVMRLRHPLPTSENDLLMNWRVKLDGSTPNDDRMRDPRYETWLLRNMGETYVSRLRLTFQVT